MKKAAKITGITLAAALIILILLILTPFLFREKFAGIIKQTVNEALTTDMNFSEMDVSFFRHFPHLTVTLTDFSLISSAPFQQDTLIGAREVSFGVNLLSLVSGPVEITRMYIYQGKVLIQYTESGKSSFEVYSVSTDSAKVTDTVSSGSAAIKIGNIDFIQTDFTYSDPSIPLKMVAHGINYRGKSDLVSGDILRLTSSVKIDSFDLYFDNTPWLQSKPVKAELTTSINMNTLEMKFEKNNLFIKEIPFEFRGELTFRQNGYSFFIALFSMFGEEYLSGSLWLVSTNTLWLSAKADIKITLENWTKGFGVREMDLKGLFSMKLNARGEYATGQDPKSKTPDTVVLRIPDFTLTSKLTNGYFRYKQLPDAITGITFDLGVAASNHNYRTTTLKLENLKAEFLHNQIEGFIRLYSLTNLPIEAHLFTRLNLAELKKVVPLDSLDLKGILDFDLDVNGNYNPDRNLFPVTSLNLNLIDGSVQTKYYPHPVEQINVVAAVTNETGDLSGTRVSINPLSFSFEGNPFTLSADLSTPGNVRYNIVSNGSVDLARIYRLFSQEGMDLAGFISTDLHLKGTQRDAMEGRLDKLRNNGTLVLRNISLSSEYLPKPLILQSGVFRFRNDSIRFDQFDARYGESDITMNGYLNNVVNYVLADNQLLKGRFTFRSNYLL
ncbi:MAG: AsmA family protein, partial [Bacteroidales bacterium]|nr:AsmA family protein [Bacteroidales bacterium]